MDRDAASSSRAWSSKLSRSARTRSNLKLKGRRVTAGSIVRCRLAFNRSGRLFAPVRSCLLAAELAIVVERLDTQRPFPIHQDQATAAEVAAVHVQVGG